MSLFLYCSYCFTPWVTRLDRLDIAFLHTMPSHIVVLQFGTCDDPYKCRTNKIDDMQSIMKKQFIIDTHELVFNGMV